MRDFTGKGKILRAERRNDNRIQSVTSKMGLQITTTPAASSSVHTCVMKHSTVKSLVWG